jgi:hypothetical protein
MQVNLIKDEHGKVIATFEHDVPGGPSLTPVLKPGHKVHEVEASEDYTRDITGFYTLHSR